MPTQGAVQTVQSTPVRSYTARIALSRLDRATLPPSKPPTQSDLAGLQPLCLDEPALGRPGRSRALYTACTGFNFALQTANLHALRAGRNAPPFPGEERGARSEERGARSEERGAGSGERGGPGRSGRCAGCVAGSNSHWQCRFRRPVTLPQAPALPRRRLRVHPLWSPRRLVCDQGPHATQAANPRKLRTASGSRATG